MTKSFPPRRSADFRDTSGRNNGGDEPRALARSGEGRFPAGLDRGTARTQFGLRRRDEHRARLRSLRRSLDQARKSGKAIWLAGPRHFRAGSDAAIGPARLALDRASGRMGASDERYTPDHSTRSADRSCAHLNAQTLYPPANYT